MTLRNHFWRGGVLNIGTVAMWALRAIGPAALIRAKPNLSEMYPLLVNLFDQLDEFEDTCDLRRWTVLLQRFLTMIL